MPATTLTELTAKTSPGGSWLEARIKESRSAAATKFYKIPLESQRGSMVRVTVPSAAEYQVFSVVSPHLSFDDSSHQSTPEFTANQTVSRDLQFDTGLSAIGVQLVSGAVVVEVVAK